jgi:hypothetical protein
MPSVTWRLEPDQAPDGFFGVLVRSTQGAQPE